MMTSSLKLGKAFGIPIGLHWSWFLIFGLMTWSLATGFFPEEYPQVPWLVYWGLGAATSILLFGSVLLHELGHAVEALRSKLPVKRITLFIFGGVAEMSEDTQTPGQEFRVAIAGPVVSLGLAAIFYLVGALEGVSPYIAIPSMWLAHINLILAVFNLIPGFPLDGGRVLRAAVWAWSGSQAYATRFASIGGQLVAFGFMGMGIWTILSGNTFSGLWYIFIGWFLQNAAASSFVQTNIHNTLNDVKVEQIMKPGFVRVTQWTTIQELVSRHVVEGNNEYFMVEDEGQIMGIVTLTDVSRIPYARWNSTMVKDIMTAPEDLVMLSPEDSLLDALETMEAKAIHQIPILSRDRSKGLFLDSELILGIVSKNHITQYLGNRSKIGLNAA